MSQIYFLFSAFSLLCCIFRIQTVILKPQLVLFFCKHVLYHDKVFEVNVLRLCFGIFTFVTANMAFR